MKTKLFLTISILLVFLAGYVTGNLFNVVDVFKSNNTQIVEEDKYIRFYDEATKIILDNYWDNITEDKLNNIAKSAIQKQTGILVGNDLTLKAPTSDEIKKELKKILEPLDDDKKRELVTTLVDMVAANLEPFGRSRLYTSKQQKELANTVNNINPQDNLYDFLDLEDGATISEIEEAYKRKKASLEKQELTEDVKSELEKIERAYQTLGDEKSQKTYNESSIETTITSKLISDNILHIHIIKFSPTTVEDLNRIAQKYDSYENLNTLILDVRGNIGGAIDGLPYFLGPFIGQNNYAYQFYSKGEKKDFITKTGWLPSLVKFKRVVLLIDSKTQSSAEVFAATFKKYNVGVLVGEKTKGWGTVERLFPISTKISDNENYSVFLVHSLTLKEDGTPIEGNGVAPTIFISDPDWKSQLYGYYNDPSLAKAIESLWNN